MNERMYDENLNFLIFRRLIKGKDYKVSFEWKGSESERKAYRNE